MDIARLPACSGQREAPALHLGVGAPAVDCHDAPQPARSAPEQPDGRRHLDKRAGKLELAAHFVDLGACVDAPRRRCRHGQDRDQQCCNSHTFRLPGGRGHEYLFPIWHGPRFPVLPEGSAEFDSDSWGARRGKAGQNRPRFRDQNPSRVGDSNTRPAVCEVIADAPGSEESKPLRIRESPLTAVGVRRRCCHDGLRGQDNVRPVARRRRP